jgi:hypothetical protein
VSLRSLIVTTPPDLSGERGFAVRHRHLFVLVPLVLAVLAAGSPVSAQPTYPPGGPGDLEVSDTTVAPGEPFTVSGSGFAPGAEVTVLTSLSSQALGGGGRGALFAAAPLTRLQTASVWGTVTANSNGVATATLKLSKPGTWTITMRGPNATGGTRILSTEVVVTGDRARRELTKTGADLTFLWAGLGLLVAGGGLVALTRVRRRVRI